MTPRRQRSSIATGGHSLAAMAAALLLVAATPGAHALDAPLHAADPVLEAHLRDLARDLRCVACDRETVADSHGARADDVRAEMRAMLRAGANDDDVVGFIITRHGDVVLDRPALRAIGVARWAGPAALLLAGLPLLGVTLRRRTRLRVERLHPHPEHLAHESIP
jgi:cytochrome c-type biogenesis protein CcmH